MKTFDGLSPTPIDGSVAVVASRYNASICDSMLEAAIATLRESGLDPQRILVTRVPGAWELCSATDWWMRSARVVGVVTLGCVIRGETTHDQHINRVVSDSLMALSLEYDLPLGFGLLTCNTVEQAIQRSGGSVGNKGHEAAEALVEMIRLKQAMLVQA
ncbi:MAG: 6,7-dimethyl-8-ribityllumazine synthase [Planctomycetota bacterium]